jgi:deoxyadenosine/deoxycytidine kinase
MRHRYIAVTGTIGSGKTTAAKLLSKSLGYDLLEENFEENAFLPRFYTDMKRWAFHSQTFFLMEKITQMMRTKVLLETSSIIQDTLIQQDAFSYARAHHELGNIDDAEWRLFRKIYQTFESHLPVPHVIVYLETPPKELLTRIRSRGRKMEKSISLSYIKLLDRLNEEWIAKMTLSPVLRIPTVEYNIVSSKAAQKEFIKKVKASL